MRIDAAWNRRGRVCDASPRALFFFDDDDVADLDRALLVLERQREAEALERETLDDRVFGTLRRARREMSAREIADRLGDEATASRSGRCSEGCTTKDACASSSTNRGCPDR